MAKHKKFDPSEPLDGQKPSALSQTDDVKPFTIFGADGMAIAGIGSKHDNSGQIPVLGVMWLPGNARTAGYKAIEATIMHPFPPHQFPHGNARNILHGMAIMARDQIKGDMPFDPQLMAAVLRHIHESRAKARGLS